MSRGLKYGCDVADGAGINRLPKSLMLNVYVYESTVNRKDRPPWRSVSICEFFVLYI